MKYLLSICIPNYNRIDSLEKLVREIIKQVCENNLQEKVQICISDDASKQNPDELIRRISLENPSVNIIYNRNSTNKGMDYNFLKSVMLSDANYCWIIGNDDMPESVAIREVVLLLEEKEQNNIAIIVTPFKVYSSEGDYRYTVRPLKEEKEKYNWLHLEQKEKFIKSINHESAIFAFLSNVIFRRIDWVRHGDLFSNKMNSIFIQMYMNLQTMIEGGNYLYSDLFIIKNYLDMEPEEGFRQRMYKIAIGLYQVLEYFFEEEERRNLQEKIVTPFLIDEIWEEEDKYDQLKYLKVKKAIIYNRHYVNKKGILQNNDVSIIIFGAGRKGRENLRFFRRNGLNVIMFVDNDLSIQNTIIEGVWVKAVEEITQKMGNSKKVKIVVSSFSINILSDMIEQLYKLGIRKEDIYIIGLQ